MIHDQLYVVKVTLTDLNYQINDACAISIVTTVADLEIARAIADDIMFHNSYKVNVSDIFDIDRPICGGDWAGAACVKGPVNDLTTVEVETIPNVNRLEGDRNGRINIPLYYVLRIVVRPRSGSKVAGYEVHSEIKSQHLTRKSARAHVHAALEGGHSGPQKFLEYAECVDGKNGPEGPDTFGNWGPDVIIHAVEADGSIVYILIKDSS